MAQIHINIGSNQNRDENIKGAISLLNENFKNINFSAVYETPPYGFEGDNFFNIGANAETDLDIEDTVDLLRSIEINLGRKRVEKKFSSRSIDLDLILYNNEINTELNIPRDDILKFSFVLAPLAEIFPKGKHPISGETYDLMWSQFQNENKPEIKKYTFSNLFG
ncbi:MAG: 2-amino-4-hydroxy-6-hydroxymethyldihydropteridine diphosphokinase [Gammaproteobacteria bacterium]